MTVQCPECGTRFPVDARKVPPEGVHARCSVCEEVFFVPPLRERVAVVGAGSGEARTGELVLSSEGGLLDPAVRPMEQAASVSLPVDEEPVSTGTHEEAKEASVAVGPAEEEGPGVEGWVGEPVEEGSDEGAGPAVAGEEVPWEEEQPFGFAPEPSPYWTPLEAVDEPEAPPPEAWLGGEEVQEAGTETLPPDEDFVVEPFYGSEVEAPVEEREEGAVPAGEPLAPPHTPEPSAAAPAMPFAEAASAPSTPPPTPRPAFAPPQFGKRDPHEKAQRLARVLISDIVLYNPERHQRALREGRLEEEFREEIRRSWEEYLEQVGSAVANGTSYFTDALNEILAKGQPLFSPGDVGR